MGGSKRPAIETLLESALASASLRDLVLVILREGVRYRARRGPEITQEELIGIFHLLESLGSKVPEVIAPDFLSGFPPTLRQVGREHPTQLDPVRLSKLREKFRQIESNPNLQERGYELQDVLFGLFDLFGLAPRPPFRVYGEEIDGSFELAGETYLLEARWRAKETAKGDLESFQAKVVTKSGFSRGLFVSMGRFSGPALTEFSRGHAPRIVLASKSEIVGVLAGTYRLDALIQGKVRHLSETGKFKVDQG